ncbi:MAG: rhodanese-like domain-containing protein [Planctomycetota bacterium]
MNEHGLPDGVDPKPEHEISVLETRDRLAANAALPEDRRLVVVDCRESEELEIASLDEIVHIPLGCLLHHPDDLADELPGGREQPVAIICRSGVRSLKAKLALEAMGFTDVRSVAGGILAWSQAIDPSLTRY